jgi:hypothetical protein
MNALAGTAIFGAVLTNRLGHYLSQSGANAHVRQWTGRSCTTCCARPPRKSG